MREMRVVAFLVKSNLADQRVPVDYVQLGGKPTGLESAAVGSTRNGIK